MRHKTCLEEQSGYERVSLQRTNPLVLPSACILHLNVQSWVDAFLLELVYLFNTQARSVNFAARPLVAGFAASITHGLALPRVDML